MHKLKDRLRLFGVLRVAGLPLTIGLTLCYLVEALVPAATAASLAGLVSVVRAGGPDLFAAALPALGVFGSVLLAGHLAMATATPLSFAAAARIDGWHRCRVTAIATGATSFAALERPEVQVLIRESMADRSRGYDCTPSDAAIGQVRWLSCLVGAGAVCAVLAGYAWWLVPLVLVPAAANRLLRTRQDFGLNSLWRSAIKGELHADVWRRATVSPSEGKDVRIFGFAGWMVDRMQHHVRDANVQLWGYIDRVIRSGWQQFLLVLAGLLPAYVLVSLDAASGRDSVAVATAVLAAAWGLFQVLGTNDESYAIVGGIRVLHAYDELVEAMAKPDSAIKPVRIGRGPMPQPPQVAFENVSFRYPGTERMVFDGLDLEIRPGELLALVGLNGAGKSTMIKLLTGLYQPTAGRITVDGTDLADWDLSDWRRHLSVVFQDFVRYHLSAVDNVALGRSAGERAVLDDAARAAGFDQVLERLPKGWDTPLARTRSGGVDLSGGQWQQLVLTRALLAVRSGARLLVLDEPTAHLDVRTEFEVFDRLARQRGETSVVLISHRLSTVRQADRIVLLDCGRITESGTHNELMDLDGEYARMFAIQAERFRRGYDDRYEEAVR